MHELSIAENIIEIVEQSARDAKALKINRIVLDIGRLSGIEMDALKFAMTSMLKGSLAEGAIVEYHEIEGKAHCTACGRDSSVNDFFSLCPHCNGYQLDIVQGKEMKVSSIEVESE